MKPQRLLHTDPAAPAPPPFERKAAQFAEQEALQLGLRPRLLVVGDSLGRMWQETELEPLKLTPVGKLAISGDLTQHILWRVQNSAMDLSAAELAIVIAGSNNLSAGDAAADVFSGVVAIVEAIRAKAPTARVAVMQVPPRYARNRYSEADHAALNQMILDQGRANGFTPVPAPRMDPNDTAIYKDGVHLYRTGYRLLTTAVAEALEAG